MSKSRMYPSLQSEVVLASASILTAILPGKRKKILYTYSLAETQLDWVDSYQYLGMIINSKLKWGEHCHSVAVKATRSAQSPTSKYVWVSKESEGEGIQSPRQTAP